MMDVYLKDFWHIMLSCLLNLQDGMQRHVCTCRQKSPVSPHHTHTSDPLSSAFSAIMVNAGAREEEQRHLTNGVAQNECRRPAREQHVLPHEGRLVLNLVLQTASALHGQIYG